MTLDISDVNSESGRSPLQLDADASGNVSEMASILAQDDDALQSSSPRSRIHTSLDIAATAEPVYTVEQLLHAPLGIFEIPKSALEIASEQGQLEVLQQLLEDGADPDYSYWLGSITPLTSAARAGHIEIARTLLRAGADVTLSRDWGHGSAIEAAAEISDVALLDLCLEAVTNSAVGFERSDYEELRPAQGDQKDSTRSWETLSFLERARESVDAALIAAAETGNMVILQRLLDAGAAGNAYRAITHAAGAGHVEAMMKLIQTATDQQKLPREAVTRALQCATDAGDAQMIQPLLKAGADAAEMNIVKAAAEGHHEILTSLVQCIADDETVPGCYRSVEALHLASRNGHTAIVDLLAAIGTDVNTASEETGETALALAVAGGHTATVQRLIDAGADLNAPPKHSRTREWLPLKHRKFADTALQAAAREGSMTMLEMLVAAGAHADTAYMERDGWNKTALSVAAECGNPEIVARMLSLMAPDDARQSAPAAVERAIEGGHTRIARQLLHLNIDVNFHGWSQHTLLQTAAKNGNFEILKLLVALKADVNLNASQGFTNTALQYAAQRGSLDAVELLLAAGADVNVAGATAPPILLAAENGHILVFDNLLAAGADVNLTAYRGQTIIEAAGASGNVEMMRRVRTATESRPRPKELQPPARGTGPLCAACRGPGVLMGVFLGPPKTLHPSLTSLRASACAGCPFCCFLWKQLEINSTSIALPQPSPVRLNAGFRGTIGCRIDEPFPIDPDKNVERLMFRLDYATEPLQEYRNPIPENTSSAETFRQIETWLKTCDEDHRQCQEVRENKSLPTRLVCVDSSVDLARDSPSVLFPRLVSTTGMELCNTKYITLSYRWPEDFPDEAKSTRDTVLDRMKGLDVSKLPLTFNDLFQVAAGLGIKYVWIDSLCIVQEDQDDWNREAALMSQIYQNAYLTVAAAGPSIPTPVKQNLALHKRCPKDPPMNRLFCRGEPPETLTQRLLCPLEDGSTQEVLLMKNQEEQFKWSPLLSRGWCFQEREISRRVIHYTKNQVLWECRTLQASESLPNGPTSLQTLVRAGSMEWDYYNWDKRILDRDLGGDKINHAWREAVEDYSSRSLTKATDKLSALAGLAAAIRDRKLKTCRYLAGIWEDDIRRGLAWVPYRYDYEDKFFGRHQDYVAPTWSWASVTGPVAYSKGFDREVDAWGLDSEYASVLGLQVLEIRVQASSADLFGAVRHASLRCSARLLPAVLGQGRRYVSRSAGLPLGRWQIEEVMLEIESGKCIGGMHFDVLEEEHAGEGITSVFCVCLGVLTRGSYPGQPCPLGPALVVAPTLIRDNEYRRVGIIPQMEIPEFACASVEEITII